MPPLKLKQMWLINSPHYLNTPSIQLVSVKRSSKNSVTYLDSGTEVRRKLGGEYTLCGSRDEVHAVVKRLLTARLKQLQEDIEEVNTMMTSMTYQIIPAERSQILLPPEL